MTNIDYYQHKYAILLNVNTLQIMACRYLLTLLKSKS
ncbi:hypothetical protein B0I18_101419 [Taibaiella chishuiensis]|uniref:Uncharacterized protein n=1 Tax=Taibaiella chishuiensis TaxID=1434707 RepID=A0A2P8DAL5_9BACT|nr:hypothetical protein B0I18_101419 [Taibaiella chishuiensis]